MSNNHFTHKECQIVQAHMHFMKKYQGTETLNFDDQFIQHRSAHATSNSDEIIHIYKLQSIR